MFYEDPQVYACLAFHPVVPGHTIVAWRADVEDLNDLGRIDSARLWAVVFHVRKALLTAYKAPNVYVACLNETRHVHWHLFPREEGGEMGFGLMAKEHGELADFSMVPVLRSLLSA
ncbi:MAG: HIT family protein [bacterium]